MRVTLLLVLAGCAVYSPKIEECALRCPTGECPSGMTCNGLFCTYRVDAQGCDCTSGETRICSLTPCSRAGMQQCLNGSWVACMVSPALSVEQCNGLDDDCNGVVDDVAVGPACELQQGVCSGTTSRCFEGCDATRYGPRYEPKETQCDGVDNDCDGLVDHSKLISVTTTLDGRFWIFGDSEGVTMLLESAGGVERVRYSQFLEVEERARFEGARVLDAFSRRWLQRGDAGLSLQTLDGGTSLDVDARVVSNDALVFLDVDAGLHLRRDGEMDFFLGPDDGGTLLFSDRGNSLVYPGGLYRAGESPRAVAIPPLKNVSDFRGTLAGLLVDQPLSATIRLLIPVDTLEPQLWPSVSGARPLQVTHADEPVVLADFADGGVMFVSAAHSLRIDWLGPAEHFAATPFSTGVVVARARGSTLELAWTCTR